VGVVGVVCVVVCGGVGVCGWCGGCGGWVWWVWVGGGGFPLRSNIPRSALCATWDTYNFILFSASHKISFELHNFLWQSNYFIKDFRIL
jgi:hypothetical protein